MYQKETVPPEVKEKINSDLEAKIKEKKREKKKITKEIKMYGLVKKAINDE